ncbi:PA3496 family putative envelope integrity protein [Pseudomonas sp. SDO528_S397]
MSTGKEQLDVEEDLADVESDDGVETPVAEVAKTNLSKRRTIDNLLEERRLQKQLADYDFDL